MSTNLEKSIEDKTVEKLIERWGANIVCYKNSFRRQQEERSRPDHLFCFFGYFVAVEFKKPKARFGAREHLQDYELMRVRRANGFAFFSNNIEATLQSFEEIYKIIHKKA